MSQRCAFCLAEPLTSGMIHHAPFCGLATQSAGGQYATRITTTVVPVHAAVAIAKLRRKLKCVLAEYRTLGTLDEEVLASIEQVLQETAAAPPPETTP